MSADDSACDDLEQNEAQRIIGAVVQDFAERRARIEQTKGMLMVVYGIDADEAFEVLRTQSQNHNIKLHMIAEQIGQDLVELCTANPPLQQHNATNVLLTAHHRIAHGAFQLADGQAKVEAG